MRPAWESCWEQREQHSHESGRPRLADPIEERPARHLFHHQARAVRARLRLSRRPIGLTAPTGPLHSHLTPPEFWTLRAFHPRRAALDRQKSTPRFPQKWASSSSRQKALRAGRSSPSPTLILGALLRAQARSMWSFVQRRASLDARAIDSSMLAMYALGQFAVGSTVALGGRRPIVLAFALSGALTAAFGSLVGSAAIALAWAPTVSSPRASTRCSCSSSPTSPPRRARRSSRSGRPAAVRRHRRQRLGGTCSRRVDGDVFFASARSSPPSPRSTLPSSAAPPEK